MTRRSANTGGKLSNYPIVDYQFDFDQQTIKNYQNSYILYYGRNNDSNRVYVYFIL